MKYSLLCSLVTCLVLLISRSFIRASAKDDAWTQLPVPGAWEDVGGEKFAKYDGFAWYRCVVKVPAAWQGEDLALTVHSIDNCHEAYINGIKIGGQGAFPPKYKNGVSQTPTSYTVPAKHVKPGEANLIAIRVFDKEGKGGFT